MSAQLHSGLVAQAYPHITFSVDRVRVRALPEKTRKALGLMALGDKVRAAAFLEKEVPRLFVWIDSVAQELSIRDELSSTQKETAVLLLYHLFVDPQWQPEGVTREFLCYALCISNEEVSIPLASVMGWKTKVTPSADVLAMRMNTLPEARMRFVSMIAAGNTREQMVGYFKTHNHPQADLAFVDQSLVRLFRDLDLPEDDDENFTHIVEGYARFTFKKGDSLPLPPPKVRARPVSRPQPAPQDTASVPALDLINADIRHYLSRRQSAPAEVPAAKKPEREARAKESPKVVPEPQTEPSISTEPCTVELVASRIKEAIKNKQLRPRTIEVMDLLSKKNDEGWVSRSMLMTHTNVHAIKSKVKTTFLPLELRPRWDDPVDNSEQFLMDAWRMARQE